MLGVRYSTSGLAISANRLAIRWLRVNKTRGRRASRGANPLFLPGGRIAKRFALIAKNDDEYRKPKRKNVQVFTLLIPRIGESTVFENTRPRPQTLQELQVAALSVANQRAFSCISLLTGHRSNHFV